MGATEDRIAAMLLDQIDPAVQDEVLHQASTIGVLRTDGRDTVLESIRFVARMAHVAGVGVAMKRQTYAEATAFNDKNVARAAGIVRAVIAAQIAALDDE